MEPMPVQKRKDFEPKKARNKGTKRQGFEKSMERGIREALESLKAFTQRKGSRCRVDGK